MSQVEVLLSRLDKVKGRAGSWTACCPSHPDKSPSLSIREADDGRVLVHCFAGCSVDNVVGAVGMTLSDLFPPDEKRETYRAPSLPPIRPRIYSGDLLRVISFEALVVSIAAHDVAEGRKLTESDLNRLQLACERIFEATKDIS